MMHNALTVEKKDKHCFDFWKQSFVTLGEFSPLQDALWRLVSGSYTKHQLSSPIIIESINSVSFLTISSTSRMRVTLWSHCSVVSV